MDRETFFGLLRHLNEKDLHKVIVAYWLAKDVHRTQTRDGGERYFEHVRGVALLLIYNGFTDAEIIIKALLHDLIEDSPIPFSVIVSLFGEEMLKSLLILSKKIPKFNPQNGRAEWVKIPDEIYYKSLTKTSKTDRLVKCADRLHNLRSMGPWEIERQIEYAQHTQLFALPLARKTNKVLAQELEQEVNSVLNGTTST